MLLPITRTSETQETFFCLDVTQHRQVFCLAVTHRHFFVSDGLRPRDKKMSRAPRRTFFLSTPDTFTFRGQMFSWQIHEQKTGDKFSDRKHTIPRTPCFATSDLERRTQTLPGDVQQEGRLPRCLVPWVFLGCVI